MSLLSESHCGLIAEVLRKPLVFGIWMQVARGVMDHCNMMTFCKLMSQDSRYVFCVLFLVLRTYFLGLGLEVIYWLF